MRLTEIHAQKNHDTIYLNKASNSSVFACRENESESVHEVIDKDRNNSLSPTTYVHKLIPGVLATLFRDLCQHGLADGGNSAKLKQTSRDNWSGAEGEMLGILWPRPEKSVLSKGEVEFIVSDDWT